MLSARGHRAPKLARGVAHSRPLLALAVLTAFLFLLWTASRMGAPDDEEEVEVDLQRYNIRRAANTAHTTPSSGDPSSFVPNLANQRLAQRILELNGLAPSSAASRDPDWVPPFFQPQERDKLAPSRLPAPKLTEHELGDEDSPANGAADCPPIEIAEGDDVPKLLSPDGGAVVEPEVKKYLPRIPKLYEPRAPKALYLPPIPITVDRSKPNLYHVDPTTGASTSKVVYALLGDGGIAESKTPANEDVQSKKARFSASGKQLNLQASASDFAPRTLLHSDFLPTPTPTCSLGELKTRAYWHSWSSQQQRDKPLNVLVWHGTWERTTSEARKGGPMGELGLFSSTLLALTAMSARVTFFAHPQSLTAMTDLLQSNGAVEYDVILIDTYSAGVFESAGYFRNPDILCRIRALDYWGTPDRQNNWKLPSLKQYLVPFACTLDQTTPNTLLLMHRFKNRPTETTPEDFEPTAAMRERDRALRDQEDELSDHALRWSEARKDWPTDDDVFEPAANLHAGDGFDLHAPSDPRAPAAADQTARSSTAKAFLSGALAFPRVYAKKFQVLVWGKEARYFEHLRPLLTAIAEIVPLVTVVKEDGQRMFPDEKDIPKPKGREAERRIRHLGILTQTEMARVQAESALMLGVGDPKFSFTPLEALQVGTPFLNPNFHPPTGYWMNGDCVITSQHPYAEKLGAPQTWNFDQTNLDAVRRVVRTALKWVKQTQERLGGVPSLYPRELEFENLVRRVNENFRTDFCAENGRPPTPAHRNN